MLSRSAGTGLLESRMIPCRLDLAVTCEQLTSSVSSPEDMFCHFLAEGSKLGIKWSIYVVSINFRSACLAQSSSIGIHRESDTIPTHSLPCNCHQVELV